MSLNEWSGFWKTEGEAFSSIMKINTNYFALQLTRRLDVRTTDEILDYGCGPGLLADVLIPDGFHVQGVDINDFFVAECKRKYPDHNFLTISTELPATDQTLFKAFGEKKFDRIILLSILQYFKDHDEIELLLKMLQKYIKPGGMIILADVIDERTSSIKDLISLAYRSVITGKIVSLFRFVSYLLFSNYRKISRSRPLLALPSETVQTIASRSSFSVREVDGLTIHASRTNYILTVR